MQKRLNKTFVFLIKILPAALFFSYYPMMHFGASESMNFEISVPIIWLLIFDIVTLALMIQKRILFSGIAKGWAFLLFPAFLILSVVWSYNSLRGLLTAGILWLIWFSIYGIYSLRSLFDIQFKKSFLKWFFVASLMACAWCVIQCVLDLAGVSKEVTLLCPGCTYKSFGFPHPNGFAIEPQFMGNLLLAPALMAGWLILNNRLADASMRVTSNKNISPWNNVSLKYGAILFFVMVATLFLTFSRGAIYAFIIALVLMSVMIIVKEKGKILKRIGVLWGIVVLAFIFTLNLQGIMAAVSPTNDTYVSGISKVLNQLSLGMIDVREGKTNLSEKEQTLELEEEVVENPVENSVEEIVENPGQDAIFDGYVEESTETRIKLTGAALMAWSKNPETILIGVGLGGAGQALYVNNLTDSPKEIVQNQYASLLLESGLIGVSLLILTLALILCFVIRKTNQILMIPLMVAFGISLVFFAGLPNALQIYLLSAVLAIICNGNN